MTNEKQAENTIKKSGFLCSRPFIFMVLPLMGLLALISFAGIFTVALDSTNSTKFCTSCHTMQQNFEEYKKTVHYSNKSGVRAECSDCHVPKKSWINKMQRKIIAAKDVWAELTGVIDTPEKFEARRLHMAQAEWARMKESDSEGCRNCHSYDSMDMDVQDKLAGKKHTQAALKESGKTCIDCHKGIAHKLPKLDDASENP